MSTKIKEIFDWYKKFDNIDLLIKTETKNFNININTKALSHILGLQYSSEAKLKGRALYNYIKDKSDDEIYKLINRNNGDMLESVQNRINYFQPFMENLENAILFEQTNENSKIKSLFLLVELEDTKFLQLGIATDRDDLDYLETFIVRNDDLYIANSTIQENIISIERYEDDELVPFSFNEEKNKILLQEYQEKNKTEEEIEKDIDVDNDGVVDRLDIRPNDSTIQDTADLDAVDKKRTEIEEKPSILDKIKENKEKIQKEKSSNKDYDLEL